MTDLDGPIIEGQRAGQVKLGIDFRFVHDTLVRVSISRTRKKK